MKYVNEPVFFQYLIGQYYTFDKYILLQIRFKMVIYGCTNVVQFNTFIDSPNIEDKHTQTEVVSDGLSVFSRTKNTFDIKDLISIHGKKKIFDLFKEEVFELLETELDNVELAPYRFALLPL